MQATLPLDATTVAMTYTTADRELSDLTIGVTWPPLIIMPAPHVNGRWVDKVYVQPVNMATDTIRGSVVAATAAAAELLQNAAMLQARMQVSLRRGLRAAATGTRTRHGRRHQPPHVAAPRDARRRRDTRSRL